MRIRDMKTINPLKALLTAHQSSSKEISTKKPHTPQSHFKSDEFLAPIIYKQIAKRQESLAGFKEYHRHDLVEKESYEISILERYLPQPQTTSADVRAMTIEAIDSLRNAGEGPNDPGNMSIRRIMEWLNRDKTRRGALSVIKADQIMVRRVIAETVKELSDRIDAAPQWNVDKLKPREEDTLTKDRYQ